MAIKNTVSSYLDVGLSVVGSIFDCCLCGVKLEHSL